MLLNAGGRSRHAAAVSRTGSDLLLRAAVRFWFVVTALGQWTFVVYIGSFYGGAVVRGDMARWGKFLTHGLIPGDHIGNAALGAHLTLAALITACGPLQLVPQIRAQMPGLHRWLGRVYLLTAYVISASALYLVWVRNADTNIHAGSIIQNLGITLDALLILGCGGMALRFALAGQFAAHRRWAVRLFLVVSGVWFFRVGVFFSLVVNQGPFGFDPNTFQGPFLDFLSCAESLLPLAIFQLYLAAADSQARIARIAMSAVLVILGVVMAIGLVGVFMGSWLPAIRS